MAILSSLTRSCVHEMQKSFMLQEERLRAAGFPGEVILSVCYKVMKQRRKEINSDKERYRGAIAIPYIHGISHRLKKLAGRYQVQLVLGGGIPSWGVCPRL